MASDILKTAPPETDLSLRFPRMLDARTDNLSECYLESLFTAMMMS